jgi:microcystin-dependent protein
MRRTAIPSDSNGVYSLPTGYLAVTGEVIQASQHNPPLEDLATAMSARLMRTGAAPMTGPIKVVDGSVGSPAVQFANGSSTGLYKTTNGIGVSIGGTKVAEFAAGGIISGAKFIGEIFDWTGTTAPPLCVLPYGQTLSRTTYADLWAFAQIEIAAGNTFYNNGNGSTTFGIGDCRGRVRASNDAMGGTTAGRLTDAVSGFGNGMGETGGNEKRTLETSNLPPYTPSGTITTGSLAIYNSTDGVQGAGSSQVVKGGSISGSSGTQSTVLTQFSGFSFTGTPQGGTSAPIITVQPTIIMNCALFVGV